MALDGTAGGGSARGAASTLLACCGHCGDVVIEVHQARILHDARTGNGWYEFDCPGCLLPTLAVAPGHLLSLLACLGAATITIRTGAPARRTDAGPLTAWHLTEFRAALAATPDVVARAITG